MWCARSLLKRFVPRRHHFGFAHSGTLASTANAQFTVEASRKSPR